MYLNISDFVTCVHNGTAVVQTLCWARLQSLFDGGQCDVLCVRLIILLHISRRQEKNSTKQHFLFSLPIHRACHCLLWRTATFEAILDKSTTLCCFRNIYHHFHLACVWPSPGTAHIIARNHFSTHIFWQSRLFGIGRDQWSLPVYIRSCCRSKLGSISCC